MKKVLLQKKQKKNYAQCLTCQRRCRIKPGKTGFCLARKNTNNTLYALNYGLLNGPPQIDPIEKKPFYHFLPGTKTLSLGSFGCNFRCKKCLNHWCSWGEPATGILKKLSRNERPPQTPEITPQKIVNLCLELNIPGISFTYNEPTIWLEYNLAIAKLARKNGLKTCYVTNGSWTRETLAEIGPHLDAANIDFKGFSRKTYAELGAFWSGIPEMAKLARGKYGIFLELTTVLIPGINDDADELKKMTAWIVKNLGPDTPWHLSQYSPQSAPDPDFKKIPAPTGKDLLKAAGIGRRSGLNFVYIWAPGTPDAPDFFSRGNTICPECGSLAVKRNFWQPEIIAVDKKGHCQNCQKDLNIRLG
ncbi:MAG: AmmeMemoRadiSam system radical SAM enzyme [Candidatus Pacebacteria bacterium]|nr:AmmeMemoRadiSam system radical SAM enzyme [Candidatus Paceibacterota bacterium]